VLLQCLFDMVARIQPKGLEALLGIVGVVRADGTFECLPRGDASDGMAIIQEGIAFAPNPPTA
jgi:hypothetical protein